MRWLLIALGLLGFTATVAETVSVPTHQSGYQDLSDFGGPESVNNQIREADTKRYSLFPLEDSLAGYFDWKRRLKTSHGFTTSTSMLMLYQRGSESTIGDKDGAGLIFRWQGSWELAGRDTSSRGGLQWRLEKRSDIGSQAPAELGNVLGAAALNPGFGYSGNFDWDLSVANWTQGFFDNRIGLAVGRLAFDAYVDAFAFQTFSRGFLNRSFVLNPTVGTTGIGALGAVAKGMLTDQIWIGAGLYDANAASGEFDWDTIKEGEFLKHIEIGWTPYFGRRGKDRLQFTWWERDRRTSTGSPKGSGWAISGSWELRDALSVFLRAGHSDGGAGVAAENALSLGLEAGLRSSAVFSLGAGWAEPNRRLYGNDARDEYVIETSVKVQLTRSVSLLPNLQLLLDPAESPDEDRVLAFGLRVSAVL